LYRRTIIRRSKVEWPNHTGKYPLLYNCNIYKGCFHNCQYPCYARLMTKKNEPNFIWSKPQPVLNAVELARRDIKRLPPGRIMFCSMTDAYQPIEGKTGLARKILPVLLDSEFYTLIITKSRLVVRDFDLFRGRSNIEVGMTITSLEDLPTWEPNADGNSARIETLRIAHEQGIKNYASMEPWIPEATKPIEIVSKLRDFVDRFIIGSMQYAGVPRSFYAKQLPNLISWLDENKVNYFLKKELRGCLGQ